MPQKPKFAKDDDTKDLFLKAIKLGMSNIKACEYAGICEATFYVWMEKAEKDVASGKTSKESKYVKLLEDIKKARATCQANHLLTIQQAATGGSWQASAWILERRFPNDFGNNSNVNITNDKIVVVNDMPTHEEDD